jgi:hypothetical protein
MEANTNEAKADALRHAIIRAAMRVHSSRYADSENYDDFTIYELVEEYCALFDVPPEVIDAVQKSNM